MASSAEHHRARPIAAVLTLMALGLGVSGCVSTEQRAAWLRVENARVLAAQAPVVVRRANPAVRVTGVWLLRSPGRLAIAVRLHSLARRALNDLPISVGVSLRRHRVYLNRHAGLDYFSTHLAVVPAGGGATWVFSSTSRRRVTGRPFAVVGAPDATPTSVRGAVPAVRARVTGNGSRGRVLVTVRNLSQIPQARVEIYAVAPRAGRFLAAGSTTVTGLGPGDALTTGLGLIGHAPRGSIELEALPTLFQ